MCEINYGASQAKRYLHLAELADKKENIDSDYQAAFYLLSSDIDVYRAACKVVSPRGINFLELKHIIRVYDERLKFFIDVAHNLFSYNSPCKATPFEISRLGYPLVEQAFNTIYIAAGEANVIIRIDAKENASLSLDFEPHQRTKGMHDWLEQLKKEEEERACAASGK